MRRYLALLTALGLILAVTGTAEAASVPAPTAPTWWWKANNWGMGTVYKADPGTYDRDDFTVWDGVGLPPAEPWKILPTAAHSADEDSWGLVDVKEMYKGDDQPQIGVGEALPYWSSNEDEFVVAMFYGAKDTQITINDDLTWDVLADDFKVEVWAIDGAPDPYPPSSDADTARTDENRYTGWVDGTGTKLLYAESVFFEFTSSAQAPGVEGEATVYLDVDPLATEWAWNYCVGSKNWYDWAKPGADMYVSWRTSATELDGWTVETSDEISGGQIPEPLSLAGLFMGVCGIGTYLRKRSRP